MAVRRLMDSRGDGGGATMPLRTSERLRKKRPKLYARIMYYKSSSSIRKNFKTKRRTSASQIVKMINAQKRSARLSAPDSIAPILRRSTRKRKITVPRDYVSESSSTDDDLMRPKYRTSKRRTEINVRHNERSRSPRNRKTVGAKSLPRREGLRPRRACISTGMLQYQTLVDENESSEAREENKKENGNCVDEDDPDEPEHDDENEVDDEDADDDDGEEEQEGRRRYDLRNRAEVRRFSPEKEGKQRPRSPRRILQQGMGSKGSKDLRKSGHRFHKRHPFKRDDDSDDSLLVDDLDQGQGFAWARNGGRSGPPWLQGGMDMHGNTAWGLNVASSGWGHLGETYASFTGGAQTAGPSSKGGADIQPLQVDESVSFKDIGGLSQYVDALKEMVFFPLLYPDFFASYHITPPRGVLLCGPPGTGKTLIARALACAASKAGQKVSFYMRKGADVLSKWVGEAERQLKLLFEEAQRNQPSIIFFDEIDGLAPVRSSKQEQIHNSIVSTLLALMDGLDSRGQVVLIGATNRIDAIDGALRRPGRFDRELIFPLPGYEARNEILDIHTRKWKEPPSEELKIELAASCVGYCGADLKALCTEAAIRAFRQKYPQVYTSDEKFVIDVDSIKVEKYHFLEAMSTITPAAHRGSIVHSRPLSPVVSPCLQNHLTNIMEHISEIFPYESSTEVRTLSSLSNVSTISLVYRPRLLICSSESSGLDHLGPAVLHELEKFPVHSLGLPSLLSDPSAKVPEEALVHIFSEARRSTPSILYLPRFQIWWETASEQLKAVLVTLLEELPSALPILLLGTSSVPYSELNEQSSTLFASRHAYQVDKPNIDDRFKFFNQLIESLLSIPIEESKSKSKVAMTFPELPKAPKVVSGVKASELKAKAEAEHHALRRLRMCLRDVCNRVLYDKRFSAFHYPVMDEDVPDYRTVIQNPMDMATLLQHVDCGEYLTCSAFLRDIDLIVSNAKAYNGDDYNGARIVSRACELRDVVQGMLSQMDPALVSFCDKIAAQGGPVQEIPDDVGGVILPPAPIVASATRSSARLRNVQPEVKLQQSYEVLKRPKKTTETDQQQPGSEDRLEVETSNPDTSPSVPSQELSTLANGFSSRLADSSHKEVAGSSTALSVPLVDDDENEDGNNSSCVRMAGSEFSGNFSDAVVDLTKRFVQRTEGFGVPELEMLYTRLARGVISALRDKRAAERDLVASVLKYISEFFEDDVNFA